MFNNKDASVVISVGAYVVLQSFFSLPLHSLVLGESVGLAADMGEKIRHKRNIQKSRLIFPSAR